MNVERFTQDPGVLSLMDDLKQSCGNKVFSDVIDDEGHQYVDLVMEGGGVLGVALVGYTYVLEEMGLRFLRIGGTSAGSINALLIAALDKPKERKSGKVLELLANLDMYSFVDGGKGVRGLVNAYIRGASKTELGLRALPVLPTLWRRLGLNPGKAFQDWLSGALKEANISSARELGQRLRDLPQSLRKRDGQGQVFEQDDFRLALVTADVSTETKVVFPEMAPLYRDDPDGVDPAFYVRASMSIPYFFHPLKIAAKDMPPWNHTKEKWEEWAGYREGLPEECVFIDGGIMSNFPIDLFHRPDRKPAAPTFGAKLGLDQRKRGAKTLPRLTSGVFNSARNCLDYDFIIRNPDYSNLLTYIGTGDHNWLDFEMSDEAKVDLFFRGADAAAGFLRRFDWDNYKKIRAKTREVAVTAEELKASAGSN